MRFEIKTFRRCYSKNKIKVFLNHAIKMKKKNSTGTLEFLDREKRQY